MSSDLTLQRERIKQIEEDLKVILSPLAVNVDFDSLWRRMEFACRLEDMASVAAQVFFSMAVYTGAWAQAIDRYWYDPMTADRYDSQGDAPEDVRLRLQWRELRRWDTQEQFIKYCMTFRPRSTLWYRHSMLMVKLTLWKNSVGYFGEDVPIEVFYEFAKGVVLAPTITETVGREIVDVSPVNNSFEVINPAAVKKIMGDDTPAIDDPSYKSAVATAVLGKISDLENTAATSRVASARAMLVTDVLGQPNISTRILSKEDGDCVEVTVEYPPDEDGALSPFERYRVLIVGNGGEVVGYTSMTATVKEWLRKRLGLHRTTS